MNTPTLPLLGVSSVDRLADVRHRLRAWLAGDIDADSIELVELIATELLTNALVHGGGVGVPSAELSNGIVRIEVRDGSTELPHLRDPSPDSSAGRGLRIVSSTSDRWGVELSDCGKTVWSEIPVTLARGRGGLDAPPGTELPVRTTTWAWASPHPTDEES